MVTKARWVHFVHKSSQLLHLSEPSTIVTALIHGPCRPSVSPLCRRGNAALAGQRPNRRGATRPTECGGDRPSYSIALPPSLRRSVGPSRWLSVSALALAPPLFHSALSPPRAFALNSTAPPPSRPSSFSESFHSSRAGSLSPLCPACRLFWPAQWSSPSGRYVYSSTTAIVSAYSSNQHSSTSIRIVVCSITASSRSKQFSFAVTASIVHWDTTSAVVTTIILFSSSISYTTSSSSSVRPQANVTITVGSASYHYSSCEFIKEPYTTK